MVLLFVVCGWREEAVAGGSVPTNALGTFYYIHVFLYQGYDIPVSGEAHYSVRSLSQMDRKASCLPPLPLTNNTQNSGSIKKYKHSTPAAAAFVALPHHQPLPASATASLHLLCS